MKVSNILYTSAFTLALGLAAPHVVAQTDDGYGTGGGTAQEQMDKQERKDQKRHDGDHDRSAPAGAAGTGTTGPGSDNPGAPPHTPGGTNPDGAPDHERSME